MGVEGRRLVGGCVDRGIGVGKGHGGVVRRVELGVANIIVAPPRAAGALGRDLPVRVVQVRARLEDRVLGVGVVGGAEVAAG